MWSRPQIRTEDHDIYRAYATYTGMKVHGAYRVVIEKMLESEHLQCVNGKIMKK